MDGRVVKGVSFLNLRDAGDPVDNAVYYDREGADELVFLDITASHEKRKTIIDVVEKTANDVFMPLTVGGGIRTLEDIRNLLNAGCDKVSLNTAAIQDPYFISRAAERFGTQCIVVAIDAKQVDEVPVDSTGEDWFSDADLRDLILTPPVTGPTWALSTHGGRKMKLINAVRWAKKAEELGAGEILLTSMDRDGTKNGYDIALTRTISEAVSIPVIASGGVGNLEHLYEGFTAGRADAVLAASIFHYREYSIMQAKEYLKEKGVLIRL